MMTESSWIRYASFCLWKGSKRLDDQDNALLEKIDKLQMKYWYPEVKFSGAVIHQKFRRRGIHSYKDLFMKRNLVTLAKIFDSITKISDECELRNKMLFMFTSIISNSSLAYRFRTKGGGGPDKDFIIPSFHAERNVKRLFQRKASDILAAQRIINKFTDTEFLTSTQSATDLSNIPENSIDYIFIDPPYGHSIQYSELNLIWEAWLGQSRTQTELEAIMKSLDREELVNYQDLMTGAFREAFRLLKNLLNSLNPKPPAVKESDLCAPLDISAIAVNIKDLR